MGSDFSTTISYEKGICEICQSTHASQRPMIPQHMRQLPLEGMGPLILCQLHADLYVLQPDEILNMARPAGPCILCGETGKRETWQDPTTQHIYVEDRCFRHQMKSVNFTRHYWL
jgi:hypothetical protein